MAEGTRTSGALQTREALLEAGAALAEEHVLAKDAPSASQSVQVIVPKDARAQPAGSQACRIS